MADYSAGGQIDFWAGHFGTGSIGGLPFAIRATGRRNDPTTIAPSQSTNGITPDRAADSFS